VWPHAALRATREDLDDAADRVGAIEAGTRTTHDFDAVDQFDRDVLDRSEARRRRAHAHAIDEEQRVVGFGAAHEQRGQLARAALVDQVDAGAAAQQVRRRVRLRAFDVRAIDRLRPAASESSTVTAVRVPVTRRGRALRRPAMCRERCARRCTRGRQDRPARSRRPG
jgi:hypothetical protein